MLAPEKSTKINEIYENLKQLADRDLIFVSGAVFALGASRNYEELEEPNQIRQPA